MSNTANWGLLLAGSVVFTVGCSTYRETFPARSATEQVLISTAADRAVERMPDDWMAGRAVHIDATGLEAYDQKYVVERLAKAVLEGGGRLAGGPDEAGVVLKVASGGLSIDHGSFLIGLPATALPVPFAETSLKIPEMPFFKTSTHVGKAKLLVNAVDASDNSQFAEVPLLLGRSRRRLWWLLLIGPLEQSDFPGELR